MCFLKGDRNLQMDKGDANKALNDTQIERIEATNYKKERQR